MTNILHLPFVQKPVFFLLAGVCLLPLRSVQGQSCTGCTSGNTYTAPSTSELNLNTEGDYCITGTGEYSGNINLNSESTLCIGENVRVTGNININNEDAEVNNYGTIETGNLSFSGEINNYGQLTVTGDLNINSSGELNNFNSDYGSVQVTGNLNVNSDSELLTEGTIVVDGDVRVNSDGEIEVSNGGGMVIGGNIDVNGEIELTSGTIVVDGNAIVNSDGEVELINGGGMVIGGNINVNGEISGTGTGGCNGISYTGTGTLNSSGEISNIDICDTDNQDATIGTGGTGVTQCNCSLLLPVELVSFEGRYNPRDNTVVLDWVTASEENNERFVVKRSADGFVFDPIGTVMGQGDRQAEYRYRYVDQDPLQGKSYYMLQQFDYDGQSSSSGVIAVENLGTGNIAITIDNITNNELSLELEKGEASGVIAIYNISGKRIFHQYFHEQRTYEQIKIRGVWAKSVYIINFISETGERFSKKIRLP